jgi:ubiquinone/menaquinone biosynthesis C-methylase UbiE
MSGDTPDSRALKRAEAASFAAVARSFARLSEQITGPLAQRLVDGASLQPGNRVLDLGAGTGIVARRAARVVGESNVVALDLAPEMLLQVREIRDAREAGPRGVACVAADAERLCFPAGSFDRALSLFALTHVPDRTAAAAELFRVVRAGGAATIGVGSGPPPGTATLWRHAVRTLPERLARAAGKRLVAPDLLLSLLPGGATASRSPAARVDGEPASAWLPALLRRAGFDELTTGWHRCVAELPDPAAFWEVHATFSTPVRDWLAATPAAEVAGVRRRFDQRCRRVLDAGGKLAYPFAAFVVCSRRP